MFRRFLMILFLIIAFSYRVMTQLNYFPLQIGNYYKYENRYGWNYEYYVWDTILINNVKYFLCVRGGIDYIGVDDSGNVLRITDGEKSNFYKLNANIGDSWYIRQSDTIKMYLESKTDTVDTEMGTFFNCMRFGYTGILSYKYTHWLAPSIGKIFFSGRKLIKARINGKQYFESDIKNLMDQNKITSSRNTGKNNISFATLNKKNNFWREYFPLQIGNLWVFRSSSYWIEYVMDSDIVELNGIKYFRFLCGNLDTVRVSNEGDVIYRYLGRDIIYHKLNINAGDKWEEPIENFDIYNIYLQSNTDVIVTGAGTFTNCMKFFYVSQHATDSEFWRWLAPDIGLIRENYAMTNYDYKLTRAIINGKKYPQVTTVKTISDFYKTPLLYQNYPNPFIPSTQIEYTITENSHVILKIYNSLGQEIEKLVDKKLLPGYYSIDWHPKNMPSGVYFYKLVVSGVNPLLTGKYSEMKKMLYIR